MKLKNMMSAEELLSTDFPEETGEEGFRRGYNDGMQAALDYLSDGMPAAWLERWRLAILEEWVRRNTDLMIMPPLADLYVERDGIFVPLDEVTEQD